MRFADFLPAPVLDDLGGKHFRRPKDNNLQKGFSEMIRQSAMRTARLIAISLMVAPPVLTASPLGSMAQACEKTTLDLGDGHTMDVGCETLSIAFLSPGTNNEYLQAAIRGVQEAADAAGADVEIFDAGWDPATQANQAQNVITSGKYNAIIAESVDGNQACKVFTDEAFNANILVVAKNSPICGRATKSGNEYWEPGTLAFVGGSQGTAESAAWLEQIIAENPGSQKVAVFTGSDLNSNTINMNAASEMVLSEHPDFDVIANVRTDYTVADGNDKARALLQANRDLSIIIANYSDVTRGVVQAVKQAGLSDEIKVYDLGGNKWAFNALQAGDLTSVRTLTPYTEGKKAVETLAAAWAGEDVPRHVPLESVVVTPETIDQHQPEF